MSIPYRLGLDIGTNTIGWAALRLNNDLEPDGLIDGGVIVFPDGRVEKTKKTTATQRRSFRSQRKRIRAKKWRRDQLHQFFIAAGLIPDDHNFSLRADKDPYRPWRLRSEGLTRKLTPVEVVDVLLHLHNRRGFKSNRLSLKQENDENKQIGDGSKKAADKKDNQKSTWEQKEQVVKSLMAGANCATFGAYIFQRLTKDKEEAVKRADKSTPAVRFRKDVATAPPPATRTLIAEEVAALRQAQMEKDGPLSAAQWDQVTALILDQRPLQKLDVGLCTFEFAAGEPRAPRALPSSIRFRIQQTLCHLRKIDDTRSLGEDSPLSEEEFTAGFDYLWRTGAPTASGLRKAMKLTKKGSYFQQEKKLEAKKVKSWFAQQGNPVGPKLADAALYGDAWYEFDLEKQDQIVGLLLDPNQGNTQNNILHDNDQEMIEALAGIPLSEGGFGLSPEAGVHLVKIAWGLPDGHGELSTKAIMKILPHLTTGETYASACAKAGYDHSFAGEEIRLLKRLPYYGTILRGSTMNGTGDAKDSSEKRYGRVANVTVHVALNQLRKLMNDLIQTHGAPQQIIVETTRHLAKGAEDRYAIMQQQGENDKDNKRINDELDKAGFKANYENRRRWRLWEEQGTLCFYSGKPIQTADICTDKYEIDHIIPRARGGFDTLDNMVLCRADLDRFKRDRTPYEAFSNNQHPDVKWDEFEARMAKVSPSKRWKCGPKATEIMQDDGTGYLPRQLTDTAYAARLSLRYLRHICPQVWATKGQLTKSLRKAWGLIKNRDYHANHFIDAVVIALTDRKRVKFYNDLGRKYGIMDGKDAARDRKLKGEPWPRFHDQVMDLADKLIPSWRPDHDASGQLHQATLYSGWIQDGAGWRRLILKPGQEISGDPLIKLSSRESVSSLFPEKPAKNIDDQVQNHIDSFVDTGFRHRFLHEINRRQESGLTLLAACRDYAKSRNIRAIECFIGDKSVPLSSLRRVTRGSGLNAHQAFILTSGNHCADIYQNGTRWQEKIVTTFDAVQKEAVSLSELADNHVMRLHQLDALELNTERGREIWIVRSLVQDGRIRLWPIALSFGASEKSRKAYDFKGVEGWSLKGANALHKRKASPVRISLIGKVLPILNGET